MGGGQKGQQQNVGSQHAAQQVSTAAACRPHSRRTTGLRSYLQAPVRRPAGCPQAPEKPASAILEAGSEATAPHGRSASRMSTGTPALSLMLTNSPKEVFATAYQREGVG